jgi:Tol biopolymer transport system component
VTELNMAAYDAGPEVSDDGLTIIFTSDRAGQLGLGDFYVSTRANRASLWSTPVRIVELSTADNDEGIMLLPGALVAYFHSNRGGTPSKIYRTTRPTTSSAWSAPVVVPLAFTANLDNPWVSADECTMYFSSDQGGGAGMRDLYVATKTSPDQPFLTLSRIVELDTASYESDPTLTADQRTIMFASDRPSPTADFNIFEASR